MELSHFLRTRQNIVSYASGCHRATIDSSRPDPSQPKSAFCLSLARQAFPPIHCHFHHHYQCGFLAHRLRVSSIERLKVAYPGPVPDQGFSPPSVRVGVVSFASPINRTFTFSRPPQDSLSFSCTETSPWHTHENPASSHSTAGCSAVALSRLNQRSRRRPRRLHSRRSLRQTRHSPKRSPTRQYHHDPTHTSILAGRTRAKSRNPGSRKRIPGKPGCHGSQSSAYCLASDAQAL